MVCCFIGAHAIKTTKSIGRFAPSPTGALHLGNLRTFLATWIHARQNNVDIMMRMEDLNIVRLKPGSMEQIYSDFKWLGLDWDLGAGLTENQLQDITQGSFSQYYQSNRNQIYVSAFQKLLNEGLVYPCSCSRKDIQMTQSAPHAENELKYANTCRDRWKDEASAANHKGQVSSWRFRASDGVTEFYDGFFGQQSSKVLEWSGDFVIAQTRKQYSYQLAVVVDDADQGVNWVIRGSDLLMSSHRQIQLQEALGYPKVNYLHLPLLIGADGKRLAKRHGDWKISTLRAKGFSPEKVLGLLAWTLGQCAYGEKINLSDLYKSFNWSAINKQNFSIDEKIRLDFGI